MKRPVVLLPIIALLALAVTTVRRVAALSSLLASVGCAGHFDRGGVAVFEAMQERLGDIRAVALEERSRSEPVSVERAAADLTKRVVATRPAGQTIPCIRTSSRSRR